MGQKIVIGPFNKGLRTDRPAFMIDNDSFPTLINAYQWRGRVKRKRGTSLLGRLRRTITGVDVGTPFGAAMTYNLNIFTLLGFTASQPNATIVPGSVTLQVDNPSWAVFNDNGSGTLTPSLNAAGGSTINYGTGDITLNFVAGPTNARHLFITLTYYPGLPVMGLEDFLTQSFQYPGTVAFDTRYSYNISTSSPYTITDVTFYKNPTAPNTPKGTPTPFNWNGQDYQQFWTVNFQGALWASNGIQVPFDPNNTSIGMIFAQPGDIAFTGSTANTISVTIAGNPLVIGDYVFFNEWTGANAQTLNFQTGYVSAFGGGIYTITLPNAVLGAGPYVPGIIQFLTSSNNTTANPNNSSRDVIRWYDGNPNLAGGKGWVNFMPPLSQKVFSVAKVPLPTSGQCFYLVGARMIFAFKDRLLFVGAVIQASTGTPIYLQDTVIFSQNGTPYYTSSFNGTPIGALTSAATVYNPLLVPDNQSATANAWFEDSFGFGGYVSSGLDQPIIDGGPNQDVLILGHSVPQTKLVYMGNDIIPFQFFIINSELGSRSTFANVVMDQGNLKMGSRGLIVASQDSAQRVDLEILDQVFQVKLTGNGAERVCSQRDFINEWVYFTYPDDNENFVFPNQTLLYNYRDASWAIFNECYTTYGQFRKLTGNTWLTTTWPWNTWNDPWTAGSTDLLQPQVIAGNQQGFVLFREDATTEEGTSLFITSVSSSTITSPNHCLNVGDFIQISGVIGTLAPQMNGKIFQVGATTTNTFVVDPGLTDGTYIGGGLITRIYRPLIMTKQFPAAWEDSRKTRLGMQQYLLSKTDRAQIQLLIFLSQDNVTAWNNYNIVPLISGNNSLIYSTVLFTCPESTNLGLTPANTNLQQLTQIDDAGTSSNDQQQIWHRVNTSLLGDTIQLGFTMSDLQMSTLDLEGNPICQFAEIELMGIIIDVNQSGWLS